MAGFVGTIAQYSPTTLERSKVPIRRAVSMISSLLDPISGRRTVAVVAREITDRFGRVCEDTCPTASPVMIAEARRSPTTISAARNIRRFSKTCQ